MSSTSTPRVVLITGTSSGFGRLLTEISLAHGDIVVATLRKPEALKDLQDATPADRLLVLKVDVTKHEDVIDAFVAAKKKFGRVDVVYNNAGYAINSTVEGTPDDAARAVFETNFWGGVRVNQEAVRFFRDENPKGAGGKLIVISSLVGLVPFPSVGFYSATKHALEAITEALAGEIDPSWNIKISLVEPGNFRTKDLREIHAFPSPEPYSAPTSGLSKARAQFAEIASPDFKMGDARKGAEKIYNLSTLENPPLRLPLGEQGVTWARSHLESVLAEIAQYESWSADVGED